MHALYKRNYNVCLSSWSTKIQQWLREVILGTEKHETGKGEKPGNVGAITTVGKWGYIPWGTFWEMTGTHLGSSNKMGKLAHWSTNSHLPLVRIAPGALTSHTLGVLLLKERQANMLPRKDLRQRREIQTLRWEGVSIMKTYYRWTQVGQGDIGWSIHESIGR